jgi:hypothetical protein
MYMVDRPLVEYWRNDISMGLKPCRDRWHIERHDVDAEFEARMTLIDPNKLILNDWDIHFLRDMQIEVPRAN